MNLVQPRAKFVTLLFSGVDHSALNFRRKSVVLFQNIYSKIPPSLFVFSLLLLFSKSCCMAQSQQITFNYVAPPKTAFPALAISIAQDPQGYMWIGQYGLHRYDGYNYSSYFYNPLDTTSLAGNGIETIYVTRDGDVLISVAFSLERLNPATGRFTHFRGKLNDTSSLGSHGVSSILEDRDGIIWLGTNSGLKRFDPKRKTITRYVHDAKDSTTLSHNLVRGLYEDKQGTIWIGTGAAFGENTGGGLNRFNRATGSFTRYMHNPKDSKSLIDNRVRAIFEDSRGNFWIGTAGDGLHTMNRTTGTFERHRYDSAHPEKLSRPAQKKTSSWADDHITFIIEDITGAIWIGTFGNGLNRYDPVSKKTRHFPNFKHEPSGIQTDVAWSACNSRDGMLWIAYNTGVFRIDPLQKNMPFYETSAGIGSLFYDSSDVLWHGGHNTGLIMQDTRTGSVKKYTHNPRDPSSISDNSVYNILEDRQGILWIGSENGLNRFDRQKGTFSHYLLNLKEDVILKPASISSIAEEGEDSLWIGSKGSGLFLMNKHTGGLTRYLSNPNDPNSLSSNNVFKIYIDKAGDLWAGTGHGGLNRFRRKTGKFEHFLDRTMVFDLLQDSDGILWAGTSDGLFRCNAVLDSFSLFVTPTGEFGANIIVSGILEDNDKNLWLNTSTGIWRINRQRNQFVGYPRSSDRTLQIWAKSFKSQKGKLFFGDNKGYYSFFPEQLTRDSKAPQIVISDFRLGEKQVMINKDGPLLKPLAETKEIRLSHDQNVFSFRFAGIHYANPEKNPHLFILENLDQNWRTAGQEKTAYYYNVPPGRYIFRVKAANSDGVWVEKSMNIIISPPWWRSWWAYVIYLVLFVGAIGAIIYSHSRSLRNELEQRKKEQLLGELQQQKTELEMQALRAQMNPHFIFNSLNSINRFILQNNKAKASEYLTKFSRLIRLILQNSQAALISLESELESLQLYLELEAVRFDHQFEYKITFDEELDVSTIKVPPLIIQPYAENAIWHGLMHKEDNGHLTIELFEQKEMLCCKITDNGIGRKKAAELKSKSGSNHKSMGMRITADRIAILQKEKQFESHIYIKDLVLPDDSAGGTEVLIKIPIQYD
jgi:ligand-binding sensor domain-containing protein